VGFKDRTGIAVKNDMAISTENVVTTVRDIELFFNIVVAPLIQAVVASRKPKDRFQDF
jgi:hypothetical protein